MIPYNQGGSDTGTQRTHFDLSMFLVRAASIGNMKHVKICCEIKRLDVNATDEAGRSAFYWACCHGHLDVVKYLAGKNCGMKERPYSPFYAAASKGHVPVLQFLVDRLVDDSAPNNDFEKAFIIRTYVNKVNEDEETSLFVAAQNGHFAVVEFLVELGADVDKENKRGLTAVRIAIERNHPRIVEYLVEKGCEVNRYVFISLVVAISRSCVTICVRSTHRGDRDSVTPLHRAVRKGHMPTVSLLLEHGADLAAKDRWDSPPMAKTTKERVVCHARRRRRHRPHELTYPASCVVLCFAGGGAAVGGGAAAPGRGGKGAQGQEAPGLESGQAGAKRGAGLVEQHEE